MCCGQIEAETPTECFVSSELLAKVLIVDNDLGVVHAFARMLRLEGYEVLTALDAEAALREWTHPARRCAARSADASMDGLTFLRRLRAREEQRRTPVAILTGGVVDEMTTKELRDLEVEVYFKPVWLQDLVDIVRRLIHRTM